MRAIEVKLPKPCKSCGWERFQNRTECLSCIRIKEKEKAKVKKIKEKEKAVIRKVRTTQKKRFSRSNLVKEADRVFSLYVRKRDRGDTCITCWVNWDESFQCWHFMSRRHLSTRWMERNAHGQCPKCNLWGAGEQYTHGKWIDGMYWEWTADLITRLANEFTQVTDDEIIGYIQKYYELLGEECSPKKYFLSYQLWL